MRTEGSPARASKLPWKRSAWNSRAERSWFDWLPIFDLKAGILSDTLQAEFSRLEGNKRAIEQELATEPPPPIRLHPNLAEIYRKKVENLTEALNAEKTRQEAGEIIRGLIDEIRLVPDSDHLRIHLKGRSRRNAGSVDKPKSRIQGIRA